MTDTEQIIGIALILLLIGNSVRMLFGANKKLTIVKKIRRPSGTNLIVDVSDLFKLQVICNWVVAGIIALAIW